MTSGLIRPYRGLLEGCGLSLSSRLLGRSHNARFSCWWFSLVPPVLRRCVITAFYSRVCISLSMSRDCPQEWQSVASFFNFGLVRSSTLQIRGSFRFPQFRNTFHLECLFRRIKDSGHHVTDFTCVFSWHDCMLRLQLFILHSPFFNFTLQKFLY